jgi:hypothetical protein
MQSPDEDEDEDGFEPRMQLMSNPSETNVTPYIWDFDICLTFRKYKDPLHTLMEYVITVCILRAHLVSIRS